MFLKLRKDQKDCIQICKENPKGKIIEPTGTGKTVVAIEVIKDAIIGNTTDEPLVIAVFSHRILLASQWIKSAYQSLIKDSNLPVNFINVNSGGLSNKLKEKIEKSLYEISGPEVSPVISTTDSNELEFQVNKLKGEGHHVIIACLYHSTKVLRDADIGTLSMKVCDEAHTIVNNDKFEVVHEIDCERSYFFTATPEATPSDNGNGMNNEERYGPVLYEMSPRRAIDIGAIVPPKIHFCGTQWKPERVEEILEENDYGATAELIYSAFQKHKEFIKEESFDPDKLGAKLLVIVRGQKELKGLFGYNEERKTLFNNTKTLNELREKYPRVKLYALSTDFGVLIDGKFYSSPVSNSNKEDFLYSLYDILDNDDAIIFHYDMISEGIDVPGITGLLPLRNIESKTKFIQNLGRAVRIHPVDRSRIENKELSPKDRNNYIKPHAHVILPCCFQDKEDFIEKYANIIEAFRSDYEFKSGEIVSNERQSPNPVDTDEDGQPPEVVVIAKDAIDDFYHLREEESMTMQEIIQASSLFRFLRNGDFSVIEMLGEEAGIIF